MSLLAALGLVAGLLIGAVGVGGVILVPALVYLASVPVQLAVAAAMCAFLLSGIVGTYAYAKAGSIRWRMAGWLWGGAVPAAFTGALLASTVAPFIVEIAIGTLLTATGLHSLLRRGAPGSDAARALSRPALTAIGAVTGFVSAVTGTGGPLVLVPILVWAEMPALAAIGLAQAIQLPIAAAATTGNVLAGTLDVGLGLLLGLGIVLGTWAGARIAHSLPRAALQRAVSLVLVVLGAAILAGSLGRG